MAQFENFLDNILSTAKDAVNYAGKKTGELVDMGKLKYQKEALINDIKKAYAKLGALVYEAQTSDKDLQGLIDSTVNELKELNYQLDVVENEMSKAKTDFTAPAEEKVVEVAQKVEEKSEEISEDIQEDIEKVSDKVIDVTEKVEAKADEIVEQAEEKTQQAAVEIQDEIEKVEPEIEQQPESDEIEENKEK